MKNLRLEKRENIKSEIKTLLEDKKRVLFIHYSCESFYDIKDGHTPRITSIAVQYLNTTTTELFSIHKIAEKKQINIDLKTNYDELEKEMLTAFFSFVKKHKEYKWVHWNMRDINYGFGAINNRYEILKGKYYEIKEENKFDLADKLKEFYGKNYIEHPRLEKICDYNKIDRKDFLSGQEEAKAFEEKRYLDLHRSTLRKVKNLKEIFEKMIDNSLKHKSKLKDTYGISIQSLYDFIKDDWKAFLIWNVLVIIFGHFLIIFLIKFIKYFQ